MRKSNTFHFDAEFDARSNRILLAHVFIYLLYTRDACACADYNSAYMTPRICFPSFSPLYILHTKRTRLIFDHLRHLYKSHMTFLHNKSTVQKEHRAVQLTVL